MCQLFHAGLDADGGFYALTRCLPVTYVVQQLVNVVVKPLLPLHGTPDFNTVADKPFHNKGRFVVTAAKAVKHIDQQDIKFALYGVPLDLLHGIAVFGRYLVARNALFVELIFNMPSRMAVYKFSAKLLLHGNVIFFHLSHGRNAVQAIYSLYVFHVTYTSFPHRKMVCSLELFVLYLFFKVHLTPLLSHTFAVIAKNRLRRTLKAKQAVLHSVCCRRITACGIVEDNGTPVNNDSLGDRRHRIALVIH